MGGGIGSIASLAGGGGGGKGGGGGSGGASNFDIGLFEQAVGQNIEAMNNRYAQLGLEAPAGDPLQAALHHQSLTGAGPSTMQQQDDAAMQMAGEAGIGQVQANNINNQFAPGSPANINLLNNQQNLLASAQGGLAGLAAANAGGGSTGGTKIG